MNEKEFFDQFDLKFNETSDEEVKKHQLAAEKIHRFIEIEYPVHCGKDFAFVMNILGLCMFSYMLNSCAEKHYRKCARNVYDMLIENIDNLPKS